MTVCGTRQIRGLGLSPKNISEEYWFGTKISLRNRGLAFGYTVCYSASGGFIPGPEDVPLDPAWGSAPYVHNISCFNFLDVLTSSVTDIS